MSRSDRNGAICSTRSRMLRWMRRRESLVIWPLTSTFRSPRSHANAKRRRNEPIRSERRNLLDAVANVAVDEETRIAGNLAADQHIQVAEVPRERQATQE